MQHTTNYALSQWEPTDRILMQDFNNDNAKLETALSALAGATNIEQQNRTAQDAAIRQEFAAADASLLQQLNQLKAEMPIVKLLDISVPAAVMRVDVDLSQIDFTQYAEVRVLPMLCTGSSYIHVSCNDPSPVIELFSSDYYLCRLYSNSTAGRYKSLIRLMAYAGYLHSVAETFDADYRDPQYAMAPASPDQIQTLYFQPDSDTILGGGRVLLWGVRL